MALLWSLVKVPQTVGTEPVGLVTVKVSVVHWVASETTTPPGLFNKAVALVLGPVMTNEMKSSRSYGFKWLSLKP